MSHRNRFPECHRHAVRLPESFRGGCSFGAGRGRSLPRGSPVCAGHHAEDNAGCRRSSQGSEDLAEKTLIGRPSGTGQRQNVPVTNSYRRARACPSRLLSRQSARTGLHRALTPGCARLCYTPVSVSVFVRLLRNTGDRKDRGQRHAEVALFPPKMRRRSAQARRAAPAGRSWPRRRNPARHRRAARLSPTGRPPKKS